MNKIAIYHNLSAGGAFNQVKEFTNEFVKIGYAVDIYTNSNLIVKTATNNFFVPIAQSQNPFDEIFRVVPELSHKQNTFAQEIIRKKYCLILIFPCKITQTPFINKYLNKENSYYMFLESKREFYEKVSEDHYKINRLIARYIRYPLKFIDIFNCQHSNKIITNSYFSQHTCKKIYKKNSTVIYPNLEQIKPKRIKIINNNRFLSIGLISYLKNHQLSIKLLKHMNIKLTLIGNYSQNFLYKNEIEQQSNVHTNINDKLKIKYLKNSTFFFANSRMEPFGLTTIEAAHYNNYLLGINEGGTPEIISNGVNGVLYPNNLILAQKIIKKHIKQKNIIFYKQCKINWKHTIQHLIKFTNTPNV